MRDVEITKNVELLQSNIETFFQERGVELEHVRVRHMDDHTAIIKVETVISFANVKTKDGLNIYFRSYGYLKGLLDDLNHTFWTASEQSDNLPNMSKNSIGANDPPCAMSCMFYQQKGTINELYNHYFKCQ